MAIASFGLTHTELHELARAAVDAGRRPGPDYAGDVEALARATIAAIVGNNRELGRQLLSHGLGMTGF